MDIVPTHIPPVQARKYVVAEFLRVYNHRVTFKHKDRMDNRSVELMIKIHGYGNFGPLRSKSDKA